MRRRGGGGGGEEGEIARNSESFKYSRPLIFPRLVFRQMASGVFRSRGDGWFGCGQGGRPRQNRGRQSDGRGRRDAPLDFQTREAAAQLRENHPSLPRVSQQLCRPISIIATECSSNSQTAPTLRPVPTPRRPNHRPPRLISL